MGAWNEIMTKVNDLSESFKGKKALPALKSFRIKVIQCKKVCFEMEMDKKSIAQFVDEANNWDKFNEQPKQFPFLRAILKIILTNYSKITENAPVTIDMKFHKQVFPIEKFIEFIKESKQLYQLTNPKEVNGN
jgi:hypothetical protein